jgi:hypothetical protein
VPTVESGRPLAIHEIKRKLPAVSGFRECAKFVHNTTHRHITFHVYTARSRQRKGVWRRVGDTDDLPMSNAQRKVLAAAGAVG